MRFSAILASCACASTFVCVAASGFDLDGDTDRTGAIEGADIEERLEDTDSVIILNNCDDDDENGIPDNEDSNVNSDGDEFDVEPVVLRKIDYAPVDDLLLRISSQTARPGIRLFKPDGTEAIAPGGGEYVLSEADVEELLNDDLTFFLEGVSFADEAKLELVEGLRTHDSLEINVAPLLLLPHTQKAEENLVVRHQDKQNYSNEFVADFTAAVTAAGVAVKTIELEEGLVGDIDVWIEDQMQWGHTSTPRVSMPVALHMPREVQLHEHMGAMLAPNVGYAKAFDYEHADWTSLDSGGNLEVTPPTAKYQFGRIYYGSIASKDTEGNKYVELAMLQELQDFFHHQKIQAPIDLSTDWLHVGHVDEIITFLPADGGSFILVLASPSLGLDLLRKLPEDTALDARYTKSYGVSTVGELLRKRYLLRSFEDYNLDIDYKIFGPDHENPGKGSVKRILMDALELDEQQVVEVPVLFRNEIDSRWQATAITPAVVNGSSMGKVFLLPDPFIPKFRKSIEATLVAEGVIPVWIDDWYVYHEHGGEVHCGSNERRQPFDKYWWSAQ